MIWLIIILLLCQYFSDYGGETIPGPAFDPANRPAPAPPSSSSSAFRPVMPSRQIVERQPRMLDFRVEYRDRNVDVVLEDSCTVGKVFPIIKPSPINNSLGIRSVHILFF